MKIGIVLHPYGEKMPGGLPRVIFEWTKALLEKDQANEYLIYLKHAPAAPPPLPGKNWNHHALGGGIFWLDRLRRAPRADVYIFNTPVLPLFFRPEKSILIVYDFPYKYLAPRSLFDRIRRIFIGAYHGRSMRRADHIIAVSESTKNDIIKFFGIPPEKITVLYHGFKRICEVQEERISLPEKFFIFAGTLKERKNVHRILEAFIALKKRRAGITHKLLLGGKTEGPYYERLVGRARESGMEGEVVFAGYLSDAELSYAYRRAEALIFPSTVEGTGNPILEAMDCGIPVITSNIFGPAELGGDAALLVDPFNVRELEEAMERIIDDEALRSSLIERGRERVKRFSWDAAVSGTLNILSRGEGMKICVFTHNLRLDNGAGVFSRKLVDYLKRGGRNSVTVFVSVGSGESYEILLPKGFLSFMKMLPKLRSALKRCDAVHVLDAYPYGVIAAFALLGLRKKLIVTAVGTGSINALHRFPNAWFLKWAYRRADRVTAISSFTRNEILKIMPRLQIDVVNHGVDPEIFGGKPDERRDRQAIASMPYVLSVGTLRWRKGYHRSIRAFAKNAPEFPSVKYLIVGKRHNDYYYVRLKDLVSDLGLQDRVVFHDDVESFPELLAFYRHADLFCLMSQNKRHDVEGFGLVFLEAAAAGLPVVGTRGGGIPDAVSDGKNGLLVDESDEESFAEAMRRILRDQKLRDSMASESRKLAEEANWEDRLARYGEVYRSLRVTK